MTADARSWISRFVADVGVDRYSAAIATAWSPRTDDVQTSTVVFDVVDDLMDLVESEPEAVELALLIYGLIPSYWGLHRLQRLAPDQQVVLPIFRAFLDLGGPLAERIGYHLWCDWFEMNPDVAPVWQVLTEGVSTESPCLSTLLPHSGPVLWEVKRELLEKVSTQESQHHLVYEALEGAAYDLYGDVNADEALVILDRLTVGSLDGKREELRKRLMEKAS